MPSRATESSLRMLLRRSGSALPIGRHNAVYAEHGIIVTRMEVG